MTGHRNILCASADMNTLRTLREQLFTTTQFRHVAYAHNLKSALTQFEEHAFDMVIVDTQMPKNEGMTLLNGFMRSAPATNRIAITDERGALYIKNTLDLVHHCILIKDIDIKLLPAVKQAFKLSDICDSEEIREVVDSIEVIPSLPTLYNEMLSMMNDEESSINDMGQLISRDIAMTAKVLQLVNSAFFGLCRHIKSAEEAVVFIGIDTLKSLVLSLQAFSALSVDGIPQQYIDELWRHSITTASFARSIAICETNDRDEINSTFTAAILHDIGRLLLIDNLPEKYTRYIQALQRDDGPAVRLEQLIFGATHQEIGAYLLRKWGLPNCIVDPVLFHHNPPQGITGYSPTLAVSAADALYYELVNPAGKKQTDSTFTIPVRTSIRWRHVCEAILEDEKKQD
jgi:HD-like signal output (HDOD) protein/CheY-like chemotaxis protein